MLICIITSIAIILPLNAKFSLIKTANKTYIIETDNNSTRSESGDRRHGNFRQGKIRSSSTCIEDNIAYWSDILIDRKVDNWCECANLCEETNNCQAWTMVKSASLCMLKASTSERRTSNIYQSATKYACTGCSTGDKISTGYKSCKIKCNIKYMRRRRRKRKREKCKNRCRIKYNREAQKGSADGGSVRSADGGSNDCKEMDTDYFLNDIVPFDQAPRAGSWQECSELCRNKYAECKFWTLVGSKCLVKSSKDGKRNNQGAISGSRECGSNAGESGEKIDCMEKDTAYFSNNIVPFGKAPRAGSWQECSELCRNKYAECKFWTLFRSKCLVKTSKDGKRNNQGAISGSRECGSNAGKSGCKTVAGKSCVFPFTYKGETHNKCTNTGSENGAVWCATNVDKRGEVIKNTWEDCDEGCPGTVGAYTLKSNGGAKIMHPNLMGVYRVSGTTHNNFPMYIQKGGSGLIYVDSYGNWVVGKHTTSGYSKMYSDKRPVLQSPPATQWHYAKNHQWKTDSTLTLVSTDQGSYVVVNAETLSDNMISDLLESMRIFQNSPDWNRVTSLHGEPVRQACNNRYCCIHEDSGGFLPWHRIHQNVWNKALNKHKQGVIMPYWDWTTSQFPSLIQSSRIRDPRTGKTVDNPLFKGFTQYKNEYTTRNVTDMKTAENLEIVLNCLKEDDFNVFSSQFQAIHNNIHIRIGGANSAVGPSSYDPVFFMHHAFIDLIWAIYQHLKPNSLPSSDILGRRGDMAPFRFRSRDTLDYQKTFGYTYNLNINSNTIVFGGMTLAEIKTRVVDNVDYEDYNDGGMSQVKIYAGFFLKSFETSGKIKYNCCNKNDCSYFCGEVNIFGGPKQMPFICTNPTKYDVTDFVNKADISFQNLKFKVIEFEDLKGNPLPIDVYQPISVMRPANKGKDIYKIPFNKGYKLPPLIRVPKICTIQIDSIYKNVFQTQNEDAFHNCNQNGSSVVPSGKILDIKPGNNYYFDEDCNIESYNDYSGKCSHTGSRIHIIKE